MIYQKNAPNLIITKNKGLPMNSPSLGEKMVETKRENTFVSILCCIHILITYTQICLAINTSCDPFDESIWCISTIMLTIPSMHYTIYNSNTLRIKRLPYDIIQLPTNTINVEHLLCMQMSCK